MSALIVRNLRVFLRDRLSVFFSFLSVLILILVYALFLGDLNLRDQGGHPGVAPMMDAWLMAGVLTITTVTTTLGAMGTMVNDKSRKIDMDFVSSPISRPSIVGAYVLSAFLVGLIMSVATAALGVGYVVLRGGQMPSLTDGLRLLGLTALSTLTSTAMMAALAGALKTNSAFGAASTLVGSLIGFLAGIYVPVGNLPGAVREVMSFIPQSQAASLLRQTLMAPYLNTVFAGAPPQAAEDLRRLFGVDLYLAGQPLAPGVQVLMLLAAAGLFFALAALMLRRKRK